MRRSMTVQFSVWWNDALVNEENGAPLNGELAQEIIRH